MAKKKEAKKKTKNTKAKANANARERRNVEKYFTNVTNSSKGHETNNVRLGRHTALYNQIYIDKFISTQ